MTEETKADEIRIPTINEVRRYFQFDSPNDTWEFTELQRLMRKIVSTEAQLEGLREAYDRFEFEVGETVNDCADAADHAVGDSLGGDPSLIDSDERLMRLSDQVFAENVLDAILNHSANRDFVANCLFNELAKRLMGESK